MLKRAFLVYFFLIFCVFSFSSDKVSLLKKKLNKVSGSEKVDILNKLAQGYLKISIKESKIYAMEALKKSEKLNYRKGKLEAISNLGLSLYYLSDYKNAAKYFKRMFNESIELNNNKKRADALRYLGATNAILGYYNRALENFLESKSIYEELGNKKNISKSLNNIGNVYQRLSNFEKALKYYFDALKIMEEIGDKKSISTLLNNIGNTFNELEQFDTALEYHKKSYNIRKNLGNNREIANSLNNIGLIYIHKRNYRKALNYLKESMKIRQKINDKMGYAESLNNIGKAYQGQNKLDTALKNYLEALKIKEKIGNKWSIAYTLKDIGNLHLQKKDYKKAKIYINRGLDIAEEIKAKNLIRDFYLEIYKLNHKQKKYSNALEYLKLYYEQKNSILTEKNRERINKMETNYKMDKKEKEIEIKQLEISKQKTIKNYMMIISILALLTAVLIYSRYRLNLKMNKEISHKNKELVKAYEEIDILARMDPLTKVSNRRDVIQKIKEEKNRFLRNKKPFALILGDIDNFKRVNDKYGHEAGDSVLKSVAQLIKSMIRKKDTIGRWGGEEFILFLPETKSRSARSIAERIRKEIANNEFIVDEKTTINISVTFGISVFDKDMKIDEVIRKSDEALYQGKRKGKNCVVVSKT